MTTYNDLTVLSADQLIDMIKTELGSCLDMIGNNEHALRALSAVMQLGEHISGVRELDRQSSLSNPNIDEPWISNYPPLHDWLNEHNARCDWQLKLGKGKHASMLEQWRLPGSLPFVILVMAQKYGWEIFTPGASNTVDATLADTKARIYPAR
jgi:hypothetical protein